MHKLVGFSMVLCLACSSSPIDPGQSDSGEGGPPIVGGGGDGGEGGTDAAPPPNCDTTKLPSENACVVNDAEGIFVSSSLGSATGDGTQAHPLASLDAGIAAAKKSGKRVYACAESYAEQIHVLEGVDVFGYFACSTGWSVSSSHAKVAAPASPAASATNVTAPTRLEAVDLIAPDFTNGSQSSIALLANGSSGLHVLNATIHAGTGGKGDDGINGVTLTSSGTQDGASSWLEGVCTGTSCTILVSTKIGQPAGGTNTCVGESGHVGGAGGNGGYPGEFQSVFVSTLGSTGWKWNPVDQGTTGGSPTAATTQTAAGGGIGLVGGAGATGANGTDGQSGINFGTLSPTGYSTSGVTFYTDGTAGTSGAPGQGGGGAGGYNALTADGYTPSSYQNDYAWGEPGGGGGAGGCPGLAATPGKGGGASFAVVALSSSITFDTVTIESSKGGDGGAAGVPSVPTAGGAGGQPVVGGHTYGGGSGGMGGRAGVSGNGGGGPSMGIVYDKTKPTLNATTVKQGAAGLGVAQKTVSGYVIPMSPAGMSIDVWQYGQ